MRSLSRLPLARVGHPVTARMQTAAGATARAGPILLRHRGERSDGLSSREAAHAARPSKLTRTDSSRPYGDRAAFVGVIDGESRDAEIWTQQHRTPYPVVADPDLKIVRAYGAERSAYTALITNGKTMNGSGRVTRPGCSASSEPGWPRPSGGDEAPLELRGAPDTLTSGCPSTASGRALSDASCTTVPTSLGARPARLSTLDRRSRPYFVITPCHPR